MKLITDDRERAKAFVLGAFSELSAKTLIIEITPRKSKRSLSQNAYYWGVVLPFVQELFKTEGSYYTQDKLHDLLKYKFLGSERLIDPTTGEIILRLKGTSKLNKAEFSDYLEGIRDLCIDYFSTDLPQAT